MSEAHLKVQKRETIGKRATKQLRKNGKLPGIYYFHGVDSVPVSIDEKQLKNVIQSEANIIDLNIDQGKKTKCVIRDVQWDPVYDQPLHVDLMGIKLTEEVNVSIPVHLVGTPKGVSQEGGVLQHIIREIDITGLPLDLPEHVDIDVSELSIGDGIRVQDLSIDKVTINNEPSQTIAAVRHPRVVEVAEPEMPEEEVVEEPELVGQEKQEGEAEKAAE